jgi:AraC family transcriptional activator of tynA and feaB
MAMWDVASRPPHEQFGYWREVICEAFVPLTPSRLGDAEGFGSRVETRPLAHLVRARLASQPQRTSHGRHEVARTDGAYLFVNLQTAGTCAVEQGGRRALVRPGQFTVVDTAEPYDFEFPLPWQMVSYRIPHALLGGRLDAVRRLTAGAFDARGVGGVVAAMMSSMWDLENNLAGPEVELALVSAVSAVAGERAGATADRRAVLRAEIERRVDADLSDPALSVATVSRRIGISPRTLHTVVSSGGETFAAMVRRRRLERAAVLLADAGAGLTITDIAASVGFDGPSSFSRAFRRQFGRSPTAVRTANARDAQRVGTN